MIGLLVVDASVAVKSVILEADSAAARGVLVGASGLLAPTLILVEVANALRKRVAAGELAAEGATSAFEDFLAIRMLRAEVDEALASQALQLAIALGHPAQDCLYLALALRRDAQIITADRKFAAAVRACAEFQARVLVVGEQQA